MFRDPSQRRFYMGEAADGSACWRGSGAGAGPSGARRRGRETICAVLSQEAGSSSARHACKRVRGPAAALGPARTRSRVSFRSEERGNLEGSSLGGSPEPTQSPRRSCGTILAPLPFDPKGAAPRCRRQAAARGTATNTTRRTASNSRFYYWGGGEIKSKN